MSSRCRTFDWKRYITLNFVWVKYTFNTKHKGNWRSSQYREDVIISLRNMKYYSTVLIWVSKNNIPHRKIRNKSLASDSGLHNNTLKWYIVQKSPALKLFWAFPWEAEWMIINNFLFVEKHPRPYMKDLSVLVEYSTKTRSVIVAVLLWPA